MRFCAALALIVPAVVSGQPAPLPALDRVITEAIAEQKLPGAVVLIGRGDETLVRKAYGHRALAPTREPMTVDTMFDLASLTKAVATTTAVMQQVETGRIRLDDRVSDYIPGFGKYGKQTITVRQLLTHMSGLRPDLDLSDEFEGRDTAIRLALEEVPQAPPGRAFIYSDINFFLLADIVARTSGMPFERYVRERIFLPLGMKETMFLPPASMTARIAPTEPCEKLAWPCSPHAGAPAEAGKVPMLRGVVHDPTARRMDGVAGHAGLFSTADDLARFARMLLGKGTLDGVRVLSPLSVERMTSPATPVGEPNVRGLGWDISSAFSSNRGDLLPLGSFGHTGFTGTSIWVDPASKLFVIFLSNRVHPDGKGDVTPLRSRVAT
ncbi:MAG TPA: serine hydrolase domain-containing protein, partial [Vicinamibacterales bacterium]|nr:serine hydrolase domain-containing protein [Vicinamibacterales bacterium]